MRGCNNLPCVFWCRHARGYSPSPYHPGHLEMRKYTKEEIKLIKHRKRELTKGHCICFDLLDARVDGVISEVEYEETKKLYIRCPLFVRGDCKKCVATRDQVDMYQAVRDLGLMQMQLFKRT